MPKILRLDDVMALTKLSRASIYKMMNAGTFPRPMKLGMDTNAWLETDLIEWIEEAIKNRGELYRKAK